MTFIFDGSIYENKYIQRILIKGRSFSGLLGTGQSSSSSSSTSKIKRYSPIHNDVILIHKWYLVGQHLHAEFVDDFIQFVETPFSLSDDVHQHAFIRESEYANRPWRFAHHRVMFLWSWMSINKCKHKYKRVGRNMVSYTTTTSDDVIVTWPPSHTDINSLRVLNPHPRIRRALLDLLSYPAVWSEAMWVLEN